MADYSSYLPYNSDNVSKNVPDSPGVYIIRVKMKDGTWSCIYVGQAKSLRSRLLAHLLDSEPNVCVKNHVKQYTLSYAWLVIPTQEGRDYEEAAKIRKYNPECNIQKPVVGNR